MDNRRQVEALRAANRGMARAVCQGAKTAKRYAALGAGMEVDAQGYGREPTAMVRGVLSCLFVCLFLTAPTESMESRARPHEAATTVTTTVGQQVSDNRVTGHHAWDRVCVNSVAAKHNR